jgi:hypothetical protein
MSNTHNARELVATLRNFITARPGFCGANYAGYARGYYRDAKKATRDRAAALEKLNELEAAAWNATPAKLQAMLTAGNTRGWGRLTLGNSGGGYSAEYTTGQYYPTEYRAAALNWIKGALYAARHHEE